MFRDYINHHRLPADMAADMTEVVEAMAADMAEGIEDMEGRKTERMLTTLLLF
jgi:hypothetical protein